MLSGAWYDATVKDVPLLIGSPLPPRCVEASYAPPLHPVGPGRYQWPQGGNLAILCGDNEIVYRESRLYSVALRYEFPA